MGLTSPLFFVVLIVAAVVAVAGAVLLWGRVPGPRLVRLPARVGMIVVCQLTAVFVVMAGVNNQYGFYASWDDLLGGGSGGGSMNTSAKHKAPPPGPAQLTVKFAPYAQGFRKADVPGAKSGASGDVMVWTPPQYDKKEYANTRFPVIVVLHGLPGSPRSFLRAMRLGQIMERQITEGKAEPAILVLPTITPKGAKAGCADAPGRGKGGTWLAQDVPDVVAHNFRTLPAPSGWAVMGISTGGYCAARLALDYPSRYVAGAALAPDNPAEGPRSPLWLAHNTKPNVDLLVGSSVQDPESPPRFAEWLGHAVQAPTTVTPMLLDTGGHNWKTWGRMFPDALTWVSSHLEAPRVVPLASPDAP
ncbi:esterase family protein [Streptomyces sp. So13.3]|uniref:alpha/beta hydrolase n=1 Tax=Streptomyces sp. So13.3 TaxID=2136173 RepID=UPI00110667FB|nr:alpha/beta hydrolase-fold protein [Streptomyces sp. So13.3]QNA75135.1 esterase family protein [Streptomyces sp. So13.3]